jgi:hypothetical protein
MIPATSVMNVTLRHFIVPHALLAERMIAVVVVLVNCQNHG